MFRDWPAAPHPTPVTARPPAGRAGGGGCCSREGTHPPPKPSPRGEGGPAKPGRMRGRPIGLTEREKEGVGATGPSFYKERLGTGSPPHQSPSGTASPQGEASGLCSPTRKKRPKSGHVHGFRNSPSTGTLRPTTPKRASGNERPLNPGGAGGIPPRLFASGLSLEKAWIPRPGPGGDPRRRAHPAGVPTGPPTDTPGTPRLSRPPHRP